MDSIKFWSRVGILGISLLAIGCGGTEFGSAGLASQSGDLNPADSPGGGGSGSPSGNPNNPGGGSGGPVPPMTPGEIMLACADATASHQTLNTTLNFPPRQNCSFGANGNGGPVNGFHMARETQEAMISLPANAVICGMARFSSGLTSEITYDDFMFLTLDDYVLVSTSTSLVSLLATDNNLRVWDWSRIYTQAFENTPTPYCLGGSCTFPGHDQTGPISLDFQSQELSALSAKLLNKTEASLKVIVTGDNDNGDCEHSGFDIDIELDYIVH